MEPKIIIIFFFFILHFFLNTHNLVTPKWPTRKEWVSRCSWTKEPTPKRTNGGNYPGNEEKKIKMTQKRPNFRSFWHLYQRNCDTCSFNCNSIISIFPNASDIRGIFVATRYLKDADVSSPIRNFFWPKSFSATDVNMFVKRSFQWADPIKADRVVTFGRVLLWPNLTPSQYFPHMEIEFERPRGVPRVRTP